VCLCKHDFLYNPMPTGMLRNAQEFRFLLMSHLTASPFAKAIYSHKGTVHDRILQLPKNVYWVDDPSRGGSLFIRNCYEKLWDCVSDENHLIHRFSICGSPGIGKSWFLFYVMYRLAQEGKSMVYANTIGAVSVFRLFRPGNLVQDSHVSPSPEMHEMLKDSSVWYLVDGPAQCANIFPINARVLQVTSPDEN
jgi:hypothetical protein